MLSNPDRYSATETERRIYLIKALPGQDLPCPGRVLFFIRFSFVFPLLFHPPPSPPGRLSYLRLRSEDDGFAVKMFTQSYEVLTVDLAVAVNVGAVGYDDVFTV